MESLKKLRKCKGLLQKDVAEVLGVAISTVSAWENDIYEIDFKNLKKLADLYEVSIDELLGRTSEPALFDNARVERPEILELYDELTPAQQQNLLNYARGMAVSNALDSEPATTKQKRA